MDHIATVVFAYWALCGALTLAAARNHLRVARGFDLVTLLGSTLVCVALSPLLVPYVVWDALTND